MNWGGRIGLVISLLAVATAVYVVLLLTMGLNNVLIGVDQGIVNNMVNDGLPASYVTNPAQVDGVSPTAFQGGVTTLTNFLYLAVPLMIVALAIALMYSSRR